MALLTLCDIPPKGPYDYSSFIDLLNTKYAQVQETLATITLPGFLAYHYSVPIHQDIVASPSPKIRDDPSQPTLLPTDFLSVAAVRELNRMLPYRLSVLDFECVFSSKTDGFALSTLYLLVAARSPLLLIIQSGSALFPGTGFICHIESFCNSVNVFWTDAAAVVLNTDQIRMAVFSAFDPDLAAFRKCFSGIVQHIYKKRDQEILFA